jgi:(4-(4-[2-(gamma-L-glutamylamino)ethyl]phenoxymethyl)furan-2-yl)methanamine synthase
MSTIIGWDIGGAHLKAALIREGRVEAVQQLACPLWLGTQHLAEGWRAVIANLGEPDRHAVTMTGELAEIFPSRREGVAAICRMAAELAGGSGPRFYAGPHGFLSEQPAIDAWQKVASANWHASAAWAARQIGEGLFIDVGSTTADIIPLAAGRPAMRGYTDAGRLEAGELVYTGVTRTSLMALATEAPFDGSWQRLMAENFGTTADLYRLGGDLAPEDDSYPASDGRGKTQSECRARIARMFGRDAGEAPDSQWDLAAQFFRERQLQLIGEAIVQVLSAGGVATNAPLIAAGAGYFLVPELARRLGREARAFSTLTPAADGVRRRSVVCAPAVAVALLAEVVKGSDAAE